MSGTEYNHADIKLYDTIIGLPNTCILSQTTPTPLYFIEM